MPDINTLVLCELDDQSSEGERKLYRGLNAKLNELPSNDCALLTPTIGSWKGVISRGFAIRADLFNVPAVRELFEGQHSTLVYSPNSTALGYLSDGNDLAAAPLGFVKAVKWTSSKPDAEDWTYFPDAGLYLTCEVW